MFSDLCFPPILQTPLPNTVTLLYFHFFNNLLFNLYCVSEKIFPDLDENLPLGVVFCVDHECPKFWYQNCLDRSTLTPVLPRSKIHSARTHTFLAKLTVFCSGRIELISVSFDQASVGKRSLP